MRRVLGELTAWTAGLFALYVLFVSTLSLLEAAVGLVFCAGAAVGARAVRRAVGVRAGGTRGLGTALLAFPGTVLAETWLLCTAAGRRRSGTFRTVTAAPGVGPGWAWLLLSATPGTYAVDMDGPRATVHALSDRPSRLERALTREGAE